MRGRISKRVDLAGEKAAADATPSPNTITRASIVRAVISSLPTVPPPEARKIFDMTLQEITGALVEGEEVKLHAFGQFEVREKRPRIGRNPRTGVETIISPRRVLLFRGSSVLLDAVTGRGTAQRLKKAGSNNTSAG